MTKDDSPASKELEGEKLALEVQKLNTEVKDLDSRTSLATRKLELEIATLRHETKIKIAGLILGALTLSVAAFGGDRYFRGVRESKQEELKGAAKLQAERADAERGREALAFFRKNITSEKREDQFQALASLRLVEPKLAATLASELFETPVEYDPVLKQRAKALAEVKRAEAGNAEPPPCCGGSDCKEKPNRCASGWSRVPCQEALRSKDRQWRIRVAGLGEPVPGGGERSFELRRGEEVELCVRAGGDVECIPAEDVGHPQRGILKRTITTEELESNSFAVSVRVTPPRDGVEFVRKGHADVLVAPITVCSGFRFSWKEGPIKSVSLFLYDAS